MNSLQEKKAKTMMRKDILGSNFATIYSSAFFFFDDISVDLLSDGGMGLLTAAGGTVAWSFDEDSFGVLCSVPL